MEEREIPGEASAALAEAMALHGRGEIDAAIAGAEAILRRWPEFARARSYLGQTLVTRRRRFADGLAELARAVVDGAADPYIWYTSGWCKEFVANELARPKRSHQQVDRAADDLYEEARRDFLHALGLKPPDDLRGDVEDMLDVIANVTGVPWDDSEVAPAAPRPR